MKQEGYFDVTLNIRVATTIRFAAAERNGPLTKRDAIDNAIGSIPERAFAELRGEAFSLKGISGQVTAFHVESVE